MEFHIHGLLEDGFSILKQEAYASVLVIPKKGMISVKLIQSKKNGFLISIKIIIYRNIREVIHWLDILYADLSESGLLFPDE